MSSMMETAEKEIIRNEILKMCDLAGAQGASEQVLRAGLKKLGISSTAEVVERQVGYLEGKGLVELAEVHNERLQIRRTIVRITPLGMDVLEGNADASGIAAD